MKIIKFLEFWFAAFRGRITEEFGLGPQTRGEGFAEGRWKGRGRIQKMFSKEAHGRSENKYAQVVHQTHYQKCCKN